METPLGKALLGEKQDFGLEKKIEEKKGFSFPSSLSFSPIFLLFLISMVVFPLLEMF